MQPIGYLLAPSKTYLIRQQRRQAAAWALLPAQNSGVKSKDPIYADEDYSFSTTAD